MTCPSCGFPAPDRIADGCGYCQVYPEVRYMARETIEEGEETVRGVRTRFRTNLEETAKGWRAETTVETEYGGNYAAAEDDTFALDRHAALNEGLGLRAKEEADRRNGRGFA